MKEILSDIEKVIDSLHQAGIYKSAPVIDGAIDMPLDQRYVEMRAVAERMGIDLTGEQPGAVDTDAETPATAVETPAVADAETTGAASS